MRPKSRTFLAVATALALIAAGNARAQDLGLSVPVEYHKLDNGLKVVLSRDTTAPTVAIAVYYDVGFRTEPRNRTGFAHLFEHMMFQGSQNLGKNEFIQLVQSNGGILNGTTRFDYTNYFEVVPSHTLETMLWAEADRMKGLDITLENLTNQQGVVANEVKVNVLNTPYGGFPWLDLPQHAFSNWHNAHNFYGELSDLEAATLEDVASFFEQYYAPNNAALVIVGDFDSAQALAWVEEYFGPIPRVELAPEPDISEPRQTEEKRASRTAPQAERPALAIGYQMPERGTPEYYAMGLIDQLMAQGRDSELYRALVQREGLTGGISAGINIGLGNMFNIDGPTLWTIALFHDTGTSADSIVQVIDAEIEQLRTTRVDSATLDRARIKMRSYLYGYMEALGGFGKADLLASFALFDDDPEKINRLEQEFEKVTPELILETAREYLRPTNRTILRVESGAGS